MRWKFTFLIFILICSIQSVLAKTYPWIDVHKDDFKIITAPKVEVEVRLDLIRRAQSTIDIVTFDQRADPIVGIPFLNALREAADRGVKVRFLTSWAAHIFKDPLDHSGKILKNPPTRVPIDFMIVGGPRMMANGWSLLDGIHEKFLIVDKKLGLLTGRGQGDDYLNWMDTAVLFKGNLIHQVLDAYHELWDTITTEVRRDIEIEASAPYDYSVDAHPATMTDPLLETLNEKETSDILFFRRWVDFPAKQKSFWNRNEYYKVRLIHHDLLKQLREFAVQTKSNPRDWDYEKRTEFIHDPVIDEIIHLISLPESRELRMFTLAPSLNPKFKTALVENMKHGLKVEVFTNSKSSHSTVVPGGYPIGWYSSLPELDDLVQLGATGCVLRKKGSESASYLHRKVALIDDTVIIGSHNFNFPSSFEADEMSFEVRSKDFSNQIRALFESSKIENGEVLDSDQLHCERNSTAFLQALCSYFRLLY
jgi:phosphatidylserine/phosphatidylglycerophosphate/cardiolipin synthase-like enzyme